MAQQQLDWNAIARQQQNAQQFGGRGGGLDFSSLFDNGPDWSMNPIGDFQMGSYFNFPNAMQGAMGQMWDVNKANQQASLTNNAINSQNYQSVNQRDALIQAALAQAFGNIGSANQSRLGVTDQLNNPVYQEFLRGNSGVNIANANGANSLDRLNALPGILQSVAGMFNIGGQSGGGLGGFRSTDGRQAAVLPQNPLPAQPAAGTQQAAPAQQAAQSMPLQTQGGAVPQPMQQQSPINPALAAMAQRTTRAPTLPWQEYLQQYMGRI